MSLFRSCFVAFYHMPIIVFMRAPVTSTRANKAGFVSCLSPLAHRVTIGTAIHLAGQARPSHGCCNQQCSSGSVGQSGYTHAPTVSCCGPLVPCSFPTDRSIYIYFHRSRSTYPSIVVATRRFPNIYLSRAFGCPVIPTTQRISIRLRCLAALLCCSACGPVVGPLHGEGPQGEEG